MNLTLTTTGEIGKIFAEIPKELKTETNQEIKISPHELMRQGKELGIFANSKEIELLTLQLPEMRDCIPRKGGEWGGEEGDSIWYPTPNEIPKGYNPERKTWEEILEPYGKEGIEFKDGEPDFTPFAEATVEIEDFNENRNEVFTQADEALAKQWTEEGKDGKEWTAQDIKKYRKEHNLTWHERSDMKTLDLVPYEIHDNISHTGGHSKAKKQAQGAA